MLTALAAPASLWAQESKAPASAGSAGTSVGTSSGATPLAKFFPKDNLIFYFEFAGLDAHADSWNKTAAYRMLTETPLGEMVEEVGAQLLDKVLSYIPGHRLNGEEIITLIKHAARHGYAMGVHLRAFTDKPSGDSLGVTMVVREAAGKESRGLWSRVMGTLMAGGTPQLETKQGRTMVIVPAARPGGGGSKEGGRSWWAEKDDLVFSVFYPWGPDGVMAALDGKVASAIDHPIVKEMSARDGTFDPVCFAFLDFEHAPEAPNATDQPLKKVFEALKKVHVAGGIQRFGFRAGFDGDALMREIRIVAPKPRKPFLALFDQPSFNGKGLMPVPDGVQSFLELSIDPNALIDSIAQLAPAGAVKGKVDQFAESIGKSGKIDFHKDFLGRIGPRMILFIAPDKSAKVGPSALEADWIKGFNPQMGIPTAALEHLPKLTLVAELSDPKAFDQALDGAINGLNHMLKAKTVELEEKAEADKTGPGAGGGFGGGRGGPGPGGGRAGPGPGGQRGGTRKRPTGSSAPQLRRMTGDIQAFILQTPTASPLKFGPSNFRPVIKRDGNHLVISVDSDSADAALKAVKEKGWKPSEDLRQASEHLPSKMVVLGVTDWRESMPEFLAELPRALQTIINVAITVARAQAANAQQRGMNGMAGGPGAGGPGGMPGRPGGRMMGRQGPPGGGPPGPGGSSGGARPQGGGSSGAGAPGAPAPEGAPAFEIPADATVELKVEPDKLPKVEDLRAKYFLSTFAIAVTDQDIRIVTREAFVSPVDMAVSGFGVALMFPAIQAARQAALRAQGGNEPAAGAAAPAAGAAGPGGRRPGGGGGAMPGRPQGGRRGRGG